MWNWYLNCSLYAIKPNALERCAEVREIFGFYVTDVETGEPKPRKSLSHRNRERTNERCLVTKRWPICSGTEKVYCCTNLCLLAQQKTLIITVRLWKTWRHNSLNSQFSGELKDKAKRHQRDPVGRFRKNSKWKIPQLSSITPVILSNKSNWRRWCTLSTNMFVYVKKSENLFYRQTLNVPLVVHHSDFQIH